MLVLPVTILIIFIILYSMFHSGKWAGLILINVSMAPVGGLLALFLARLQTLPLGGGAQHLEIELASYPERPYSQAIASRLFSPLGYRVQGGGGRLRLEGERRGGEVLRELPVLLLALDRRTRLFLSGEELQEIGRNAGWVTPSGTARNRTRPRRRPAASFSFRLNELERRDQTGFGSH
jgi:hypothetical protein